MADNIDVLINNAGIASADVSEAFTADQAKVLFNTSIVGVLRTRAVLPAMRAAGDGLIVNIGSILGRITFPFFGIDGGSNFAVEALTDNRYELPQLGVDVVIVQPSAYPTNPYASSQQPIDAACVQAYGAIGAIQARCSRPPWASSRGRKAQTPHDVATAIASIVGSPRASAQAHCLGPKIECLREVAPKLLTGRHVLWEPEVVNRLR